MQTMPGRPRGSTWLARALGLDGNPLRRASDRAEAWIRVGLLGVFLIAGPVAALGVGGWAYHAGITAARVQAAPAHRVKAAAFEPASVPTHLDRTDQAWAWNRGQSTAPSARSGEVLAMIMRSAASAAPRPTPMTSALQPPARSRLLPARSGASTAAGGTGVTRPIFTTRLAGFP